MTGTYAISSYMCYLFSRYSDNQRAQDAINITFFHWGIHGWIVYVIIGLVLGFVCYRKRLQMSMRTCFYPLVGDRIYGYFGDFIDTLSIICTMFGVCTSLGKLNLLFQKLNIFVLTSFSMSDIKEGKALLPTLLTQIRKTMVLILIFIVKGTSNDR